MERERLIKLQDLESRMKLTPKDYRIYVELGDYYMDENVNKAYLCFEHSLVFCEDEDVKADIIKKIDNIKAMECYKVHKTSIVIVSYNSKELIENCINSIREHSYYTEYEIVVVDNASDEDTVSYLKTQEDIVLRLNEENVGCTIGYNQGIVLANEENDIMLLNNDTVMCINSLFWLRMCLYEDENIGACGSVTNYAANNQIVFIPDDKKEEYERLIEINNSNIIYSLEPKRWLAGFAVVIKRKVLDKVGLLEEIFTPGTFEDVDYGIRINKAGYVQYLCHNSYIKHIGSQSYEKHKDILDKNNNKFLEKWGQTLEEITNGIEIVFRNKKYGEKEAKSLRRAIDEKRYMDFWRIVFSLIIKEDLKEYNKFLFSDDEKSIYKVLEKIKQQGYVKKYRASSELTSLIVYLSIYVEEINQGVINHIFSYADSLEMVEKVFLEFKYALWRVSFIADQKSYMDFINLVKRFNISNEYMCMLIKTSAMNQLEAYYTIGYLMRTINKDVMAVKLYNKALELSPDEEVILCELADLFWKYGKVDVAMNYMSKITNPTSCTEKYLQKWGIK